MSEQIKIRYKGNKGAEVDALGFNWKARDVHSVPKDAGENAVEQGWFETVSDDTPETGASAPESSEDDDSPIMPDEDEF